VPGPGQSLADLAAQLTALLRTRLELLGLEALEARDRMLCRLAVLLAAATFLLLALLVATVAFALHFWPGENRILALGLLALAYAVLGAGMAVWLVHRLRQDPAPFTVTTQVLDEDAQVLRRDHTRQNPARQSPGQQDPAWQDQGAQPDHSRQAAAQAAPSGPEGPAAASAGSPRPPEAP